MIAMVFAALVAVQCPDGSPPPCARPQVRAQAIDANRIAVLPFRVTSADSLLGNGIAELVAAEFSGEPGPRAVHMGSVLQAWRRAGGSSSRPLAQAQALRAARELGAGMLVEGSIVGLGQRLTINTSVVSVADGRVRRAPTVSSTSDSLDVLLRRVVTGLIGIMGGQLRSLDRGLLTDSPDALRAYMEALAAWRRADSRGAALAAERAIGLDSSFAQAHFLRYRIANWEVAPDTRRWALSTSALRDKLSAGDRTLFASFLGSQFPAPRHPRQNLADRTRAVEQMPDSPEALYALGDYLYHYGGGLGISDRFEQARALLERSYALDSQATILVHLMEFAVVAGDLESARRYRPFFEQLGQDNTWGASWAAAARTGDDAWLAQLRRHPATTADVITALGFGNAWGAPPALMDEMRGRLPASATAAERRRADVPYAMAAVKHGRRDLARRLIEGMPGPNGLSLALQAALFGDGDTALGAQAVAQMIRLEAPRDSGGMAARQCGLALWSRLHGGGDEADSALLRAELPNCATLLTVLRARGAPGYRDALLQADSVLRTRLSPAVFMGAEHVVMYRLWLELGDTSRALAMTRSRPFGFGNSLSDAVVARDEGRLALALGDSARARRAFREYLEWRRNPDPALVPERDSVRAVLEAIERRRE